MGAVSDGKSVLDVKICFCCFDDTIDEIGGISGLAGIETKIFGKENLAVLEFIHGGR